MQFDLHLQSLVLKAVDVKVKLVDFSPVEGNISNLYQYETYMPLIFGTRFLALSRNQKRAIMLLADFIFLPAALWSAYALRFNDPFDWQYLQPALPLFFLIPFVGLLVFIRLGLYRAVVRFMGNQAVWSVVYGTVILALALYALAFLLRIEPFPRSIPINFALVALVYVGGSRLLVRHYYQHMVGRFSNRIPVAIYGAGGAGVQLALSLDSGSEYNPVVFLDDSPQMLKANVAGRRVYGPESLNALIENNGIEQVLLAVPNASVTERRRIVQRLSEFPVRVQTIPSMPEIIQGRSVDALADVGPEDLLNRESVPPMKSLYRASIVGKVVMVTGAGGSIGSEICRQAAASGAAKLVLFELSEFALYSIERELSAEGFGEILVPLLGNVCDSPRVNQVMKAHAVQTVYHAAAYKHVPIVENNVVEGFRNNAIGTRTVGLAAIENQVERFVLISTDKAVRPTNVMGATKRVAELFIQDLATRESQTRFGMVRFGNVLGSSGSVVPVFQKQIRSGGPVTVTHKEITRYFMTIPEAASLVIQAGAMAQGGDVFVLDMGKSVKIVDLARRMIHLAGLTVKDENNPEGDIWLEFQGLRPGEKLYEELLIGEDVSGTEHPKIMRANEKKLSADAIKALVTRSSSGIHRQDSEFLVTLLSGVVDGFTSPRDLQLKTPKNTPTSISLQ